MKPIFATCPINVAGRHYQAGQQIQCGSGTRSSLLRFQQAVEGEEGQNEITSPDVPNDESPAGQDDEQTPLADLQLDADIIGKLSSHGIVTIEQLQAFLASGKKLRSLAGIGEATDKRITQALQTYDQPDI